MSIQGEWVPWQSKVPNIEVETHKVAAPDVVIPTVDTVRHEVLLYTWLAEHKPLVLCGPPGSGKTMTLFCSLRSLPDMEVNFHCPLFLDLCMSKYNVSGEVWVIYVAVNVILRLRQSKLYAESEKVVNSIKCEK